MINKSGQKDIKEGDNLEPGDGVGPIGSAGVGTVTEYDEDTYIFDDQPYRILVDKPDGDGFLRVTTESDPYGFSVQCWDGTFDYEVTTNVEISFDDDGDPVYGNTVSGTVNEDESSPHGYITEPSEAPRLSTVKFSEPNSSSGFTMQFYPD
ncbi:hypothetical protein SVXHr_0320 [Halorhabdus sp. SVX81]|nr:hypothetical protein SVXHr_0320 [Halorhabdus sp. SVX81]